MTKTKQDQVPNIYQLEEISENVFKIIGIFNSQKDAARKTEADQGNIQHAITNHVKGCGYYWCNETSKEEFEANWRPARTRIKPCAELDSIGNIIKVHYNRSLFEKEYGWTAGVIKSAITRFLKPVSTIPIQKEVHLLLTRKWKELWLPIGN